MVTNEEYSNLFEALAVPYISSDLPICPKCGSPLMGIHKPEEGCPIICVWNEHVLTREETRQPPCFICQQPKAVRKERAEGVPFQASWHVKAPWAHPAWTDYAVLLLDLTTETGAPVNIYRDGMGYEMWVYVISPKVQVQTESENMDEWSFGVGLMYPPNHVYQFPADSDDDAFDRVGALVNRIAEQSLSPDTDAQREWDHLFADGFSLKGRNQ